MFDETQVEPLAGYLAVAGSQEIGPNASTVGFTVTAVRRDIDDTSPVSSVLNNEAYTGELNWEMRFLGGAYEFGGSAGVTHVSGTEERITSLQRSSVHYYQRPDASYIRLDSTRTSLNGFATDTYFSKNNGRWTGFAFLGIESPGYDPNDLGRLGRADEIAFFGEFGYRQTTPSNTFHRYAVELSQFTSWNFGGQRNTTGIDGSGFVTWKNFWSTRVFAGVNLRDYSDTATRGGPRMAIASERNIGGSVSTNSAKRFSADLFLFYESDELERRDFRIEPEFNWQPSERIELSLEPGWSRSIGSRQYVSTRTGGPEATFGSRYIFSLIDRTELSTQLRLNYTFSPDLTLELLCRTLRCEWSFLQLW